MGILAYAGTSHDSLQAYFMVVTNPGSRIPDRKRSKVVAKGVMDSRLLLPYVGLGIAVIQCLASSIG